MFFLLQILFAFKRWHRSLEVWEKNRDFVFFTSTLWMEWECSVSIRHTMTICLMESESGWWLWYKVILINTAVVLHWLGLSCHSLTGSVKLQSSLNMSLLSTPSWWEVWTPYFYCAVIHMFLSLLPLFSICAWSPPWIF